MMSPAFYRLAPLAKKLSSLLFCLAVSHSLSAQVPQVLSYQGRVISAGINFDGAGKFKFALVDGGMSSLPGARVATATAVVTSGFVTSIVVNDGGSGYQSAPAVSLAGGEGAGASASAIVSGGQVTQIVIVSPGSGYTSLPEVSVSPPVSGSADMVYTTYWSHDGTSVAGTAPHSTLTLPVTKGLYSVLLGSPAVSGMSSIPPSVFDHPEVYLRVWFDDGVHGMQLLSPDQRIAAVGYAIMASSVADGAITSDKLATGAVGASHLAAGAVNSSHLSAGSVGAAQIANGVISADKLVAGSIGSAQLSNGAVTAANLASGSALANLQASGQSGVTSGGVVLSPVENNTALLAAGYTKLPYEIPTDKWESQNAIANLSWIAPSNEAVWTGSEMLVWGNKYSNQGLRHDPQAGTWQLLSTVGAPQAREQHVQIWAGNKMMVWGGEIEAPTSPRVRSGGLYDPALNAWTATSEEGAPAPRYSPTAVWTGSEVIIWGGRSVTSGYHNDGARYNPATNTWLPVSTQFAPIGRFDHMAVWTGSEMIIWGGQDSSNLPLGQGARYNPTTDQWRPMNQSGPLSLSYDLNNVVWTGNEMIIVSSYGSGAYNPVTDTWKSFSRKNEPVFGRALAVWTGKEILVWNHGYAQVGSGYRYNPQTDKWAAMSLLGSPPSQYHYTGVWTGEEFIFWGVGLNDRSYTLTPGEPMYLYMKP
ncbi:hypothetical protein WJU23_06515 [Prosthecobacter sp. SYSU 5D2]|uniref:Kelch repeat-containing protein n=1 Tax=Prosthecobacter sp. SYSU 5D2 TaxID=3134134 RepID=UPI0031FE63DF